MGMPSIPPGPPYNAAAIKPSASVVPTAAGTVDLGTGPNGFKRLYMDYTNTGTVGTVTINKAAGKVNLATAATTLTVNNSLVTVNSIIMLQLSSASAASLSVVASSGSFMITATGTVTSQLSIAFFIVSTD